MFFNIRLLEEPFQEFGCGRKHVNEVDNDSSCSSDSLDYSKFSMGSIVGDSIGSLDNFDLHKTSEDKEVSGKIRKDDECGVANEDRQGEKGCPVLNEELENLNVEGPVGEVNRVMTLVDKSVDLIVDLSLGPLYNLNLGPALTMGEHSGGSESISCWSNSEGLGPVVDSRLAQPILLNQQRVGQELDQYVVDAELQHKSSSPTQSLGVHKGGARIQSSKLKEFKRRGGSRTVAPVALSTGKLMKFQKKLRVSHASSRGSKEQVSIWETVWFAAVWVIWCSRNAVIFKEKQIL